MRIVSLLFVLAALAPDLGAQCIPGATDVSGGLGISRVVIDTLDNFTSTPVTDYSSYAGTVAAPTLPHLSTHPLSVWAPTGFRIAIWIDWNQDLTFAPSEKLPEQVSQDTSSATVFQVTVPQSATLGNCLMRIRALQAAPDVDPCLSTAGGTQVGESEDYHLEVTPAITITTTSLAPVQIGFNYSQSLQATGTVGTFTWTLTSGTLPDGLLLGSAGVIVGVARAGSDLLSPYSLTFQIADSAAPAPNTASRSFNLTVLQFTGFPIDIATTSLPAATVGQLYAQSVLALNGANPNGSTNPHNFSISTIGGGFLPTGMTLSSLGLISGVPSLSGVYSFLIVAEDPAGFTDSQSLTIIVNDPAGGGGGGGGGPGPGGGGTVTLQGGGGCTMATTSGSGLPAVALMLLLLLAGLACRRRA